jgi:hypothetical protein
VERGRHKRPGLDANLNDSSHRFDVVMCWAIDRHASLIDLLGTIGHLKAVMEAGSTGKSTNTARQLRAMCAGV